MLVIGIDHQIIHLCQFPSLKSTYDDLSFSFSYKLSYWMKSTYVDFVNYANYGYKWQSSQAIHLAHIFQ